jgi:hypothetical protein
MKKLELVYIGKPTSRFEYGELYRAFSFNDVGIMTFLDKDGRVCEMNKDAINKHFSTLSRFIKLKRDKKINEILK